MENDIDETARATLVGLESRLLRIEHVLLGSGASDADAEDVHTGQSAIESLTSLDRRLAQLVGKVKVYADILRLYRAYPSFFQPATPHDPPSQLDEDTLRAIVLSYASSFPTTISTLTAVTSDIPIPDPKYSAKLVSLAPRMEQIEARQEAQDAEMLQLRIRSERIVRSYMENRIVEYGQTVADLDTRVKRAGRTIRRAEVRKERAAEQV